MPMLPRRLSMSRWLNTSRTSPLPRTANSSPPSAVMMPAASWPRCCSTVSASYNCWLTGPRPAIPAMPHMLCLRPLAALRRPSGQVISDHCTQQAGHWCECRHQLRLPPPVLVIHSCCLGQYDDQRDDYNPAHQPEQETEHAIQAAEQRHAHEAVEQEADDGASHQHGHEDDAARRPDA